MLTISDSAALILLSRIQRLAMLQQVFETIVITPEVFDEVATDQSGRAGAEEVRNADWIQIVPLRSRSRFEQLIATRGAGESSVIALAEERAGEDVLMILDDGPARATANRMGLRFIGTAGALVLAKRHGVVLAVAPILDELLHADMRLAPADIERVLFEAGELPSAHA